MPGSIMPSPVFTGLDNNGDPLAGGLLYVYLAGTSTPTTVYSDQALTIPLSNPVVLDSAGRAIVFLDAGSFKFVLHDADDALIWTSDGVQSTHTNQTALGDVFFFGGDASSPITAAAYPAGATYDKCHAGTSLFRIDSGDLPSGTYVLEGMLMATGGATTTAALVNLTDGSPDAAMVEISSASTTGARVASGPITFPTAGADKDLAIKVKVSTPGGWAWGLRLRRTA